MAMSDTPSHSESVTLALSTKEQWTLHHMLLDRIEATPAATTSVNPPPVAVYLTFETLDSGETTFTIAQLSAMQPILAEYHYSPEWETDRPELEALLQRITNHIDQHDSTD